MSRADDRRRQERNATATAQCPVCSQPPSELCISVTGIKLMQPHAARLGEAWRVAKAKR